MFLEDIHPQSLEGGSHLVTDRTVELQLLLIRDTQQSQFVGRFHRTQPTLNGILVGLSLLLHQLLLMSALLSGKDS